MIASGGLSGGISSSIAGGNFWDGARQGIITSGLNHLAHNEIAKIQQNKLLRDMITEKGYDPDIVATMTQEELVIFVKKVFPELYASGGKPSFDIVETGSLGEDVLGRTRANYFVGKENPDLYIKLNSIRIMVAKEAFRNYLTLGRVIGHELIHAVDHFSGNFLQWNNKFSQSFAIDLTELNAHEWEISVGAPSTNYTRYNQIYLRIHGID